MGSIYANAFDRIIQGGGLRNIGNANLRLQDSTGGAFPSQDGVDKTFNEKAWSRGSGESLIPGSSASSYDTWTASQSDAEAGQLLVQVPDSGGSLIDWLLFDENDPGTDFTQTGIGLGADVTITPGSIDAQHEGLAELLLFGLSSGDVDYVLKNGSGTTLATLTSGSTGYADLTYDATNRLFTAVSDVTFENTSGSSWSAEELQLQAPDGSVIYPDTSFSVNVPDGGSLTFTTIELDIANLT